MTAEEREDLRWYLEEYLDSPYAVYAERGQKIASQLERWGSRFFEAVFSSGKPRDAYVQARSAEPCELWISAASPDVLGLPWELLHDPERATPLALDIAGINRTLQSQEAPAVRGPGAALRVLMVIARPYGRKDVPYRTVARPLLKRLEPVAGEVQLEVLRPPTFARLKERLAKASASGEPYHVLHFDGHGAVGGAARGGSLNPRRYQASAPEGLLVFETEHGTEDRVPVSDLAPLLSDAGIPLLVFNACQSGTVGGGTGPEAAVATRLLAEGSASVVAMGYTVYAVAAAEFMAAFYEALFAGLPVSQAVTAGRRQLHKEKRRPSPKGPLALEDWFVPVHYARSEISFPELRRQEERPEGLSLSDILAEMREPKPAPEGVHEEGDLAAEAGLFFGRDAEFHELERALRTEHVVLLHGTGGSGKTELAKGFARWLQESGGLDDPSWVFFHSFEPGVASFGLDGVVNAVGLRLFGAEFAQRGPEERRAAVLGALCKKRVLLVWDNFETVHSMPAPGGVTKPLDDAQRLLMKTFLVALRRGGEGGVILTSRSPEPWLGGNKDLHRLEVAGLDAKDVSEYADALLAGNPRAQERRGDPAYPDLLGFLGGHPLSLRLILSQLAGARDARELLEALHGERALPAVFEGGEGRLGSLAACVHYSFHHLAPEHQERLQALALFEGVADVDVLAALSWVEGTPERFAGVTNEEWKEALEACVAAGLLTGLGAGMYRIHPALPQFLSALWRARAGAAFAEEHAAASTASVRAHAALADWLVQQIHGGGAETAFAVLEAERHTLGGVVAIALTQGMFDEAQSIIQPLSELWDSRGLLEEARAWVERCRERLEDDEGRQPDFDTPGGALWLFVVGSHANRLQRAGALDEAEAAHDRIRQALEPSTRETAKGMLAVTYHQLGMVAQHRGDLATAEGWYRQSLAIKEALGNRPGTASSYHQLGIVAQLRGDLPAAQRWYRQGLAIFKTLGDQAHLASSYHQLGRVAQDRGDLVAAERWFRKSLEIKEALGNQPGTAGSYHQLGMVAQDRGDLARAERWFCKALEIRAALADEPGMASSYHQLGRVAQDRGDLAAAERWFRQSLEITEALGNRPGMASSYHQLGMVAQDRGDLAAAERWYRRSLEIEQALDNRPGMASSYHQLATAAQDRGDLAAAERWCRRSLEIEQALDNRPGTSMSYGQLGLLAEARGDDAGALDWTVRCVTVFPEFPHPATGPAPQHLAQLTVKLGWPALEQAWQRHTGAPLPQRVRTGVAKLIRRLQNEPAGS